MNDGRPLPDTVRELAGKGLTDGEIADMFGVDRRLINRIREKNGIVGGHVARSSNERELSVEAARRQAEMTRAEIMWQGVSFSGMDVAVREGTPRPMRAYVETGTGGSSLE